MFLARARDCLGKIIFLVIAAAGLAVFTLLSQGCSGITDEDLETLKRENQSLALELEQEKRQSDLLDRALTSVYKERDRLVDLLNAPPAPPEEASEDGEASAETDEPRIYVVQTGDTLSAIARRYRTTTDVLLTLNPMLRQRPNMMVWENDRLTMPR